MHVGVIGVGRVGRAVISAFERQYCIVAWDVQSGEHYPAEGLDQCQFAVVCVDTPEADGGVADISRVEEAVERLPCSRVLIKSTVPPGTTSRLRSVHGKSLCYWPEYVGESRYFNPHFPEKIEDVPFLIFGGHAADRTWFIDRLLPIFGPTKVYYQCSSIEAEVIKYAENAYFATKITFVNEMRRMCDAFGADWHSVREGWLLDPRIDRMHTAAFQEEPGFGGKCLPKDLKAIVCAAAEAGYSADLLRQVIASNDCFRGAE